MFHHWHLSLPNPAGLIPVNKLLSNLGHLLQTNAKRIKVLLDAKTHNLEVCPKYHIQILLHVSWTEKQVFKVFKDQDSIKYFFLVYYLHRSSSVIIAYVSLGGWVVGGAKPLTSSGRFYKWGRAGWPLQYTSSLVEFLCLNRDYELLVIKHPYREHIMFILVTLYLSSVLSPALLYRDGTGQRV